MTSRLSTVFIILILLLAACVQDAAAPVPDSASDSTASGSASDSESEVESGYKLAAIFPGTITDADYNTLGHIGITTVQDSLGVEAVFSESVAVPDVDRVMREYIDDGANIIFTHGGQFLSQTLELANEFPDLFFIAEADAEIADAPANVWVMVRNMEVGAYGAGALAAELSSSGKVGYIAGLTLPLTYAEVHAMEQAIEEQGLAAEVIPVWAGDFNDPAKARELADALIADGVDVIVSSLNLGTLGVFESVKNAESPVLVIAKYTDKSEFAPEHYVTSMLYDFAGPLTDIVTNIQAGESGGMYPFSFATGIDLQFPLQNASEELSSGIEALLDEMKAGNVEVVKNIEPIE
ncbi:MAG: BMP family protein [Chloroflexota bacterium]